MSYKEFRDLFPDIAKSETRTLTVSEHSDYDLPAAHYTFIEMFCDEPGCDCRRVFFYVVSSLREGPEAVIAYGWGSTAFYEKWMGDDDPLYIEQLKGPVFNLSSPRSGLANAVMELCKNELLNNEEYMERVKRHYQMFRRKIDGKPTFKIASTKSRKKKKKKT